MRYMFENYRKPAGYIDCLIYKVSMPLLVYGKNVRNCRKLTIQSVSLKNSCFCIFVLSGNLSKSLVINMGDGCEGNLFGRRIIEEWSAYRN